VRFDVLNFRRGGEVTEEVVYADSLRSQKAVALTAVCDFGLMKSHLQANMSLALLIIASFNRSRMAVGARITSLGNSIVARQYPSR
jgi:hypothetical protein